VRLSHDLLLKYNTIHTIRPIGEITFVDVAIVSRLSRMKRDQYK